MGLRSEMKADRAKCRGCGAVLYQNYRELARRWALENGIKILTVDVACQNCKAVKAVRYWGFALRAPERKGES